MLFIDQAAFGRVSVKAPKSVSSGVFQSSDWCGGPTTVVPVEALGQAGLLLKAIVAGAEIHLPVLDRPPQPLDKNVVVAAPAPAHADLDPGILEHVGEFGVGGLGLLGFSRKRR